MLEARAEWHWVSLGLPSKQNQQFLSTLTLPLLPKDKNKDWMALLDQMPLPLGKPYVPLPALVAHTCQAGENLQCPRNKACSSDVHNRPFSKPSFSPSTMSVAGDARDSPPHNSWNLVHGVQPLVLDWRQVILEIRKDEGPPEVPQGLDRHWDT